LYAIKRAYWPIADKVKIKTQTGYVEKCYVLERSTRSKDSDDSKSYNSDSESCSSEDDDEEITFRQTGECVAVKVHKKAYLNRLYQVGRRYWNAGENPIQELSAMQIIGNDSVHVIGAIEALMVDDNLNIVMPLLDSGELFYRLYGNLKSGTLFPEIEAKGLFRQIMAGIKYLHQKGICHRDLSPENVMVDRQNNAVIIDMGQSILIPYTDPNGRITRIGQGFQKRMIRAQGRVAKASYCCQEIYHNFAFDGPAVDIWAAGTILFAMLFGYSYKMPLHSDNLFVWIPNLTELFERYCEVKPSDECIDLLQRILQKDQRLRYTIDEILNHPWLNE